MNEHARRAILMMTAGCTVFYIGLVLTRSQHGHHAANRRVGCYFGAVGHWHDCPNRRPAHRYGNKCFALCRDAGAGRCLVQERGRKNVS